MSTKGTPQPDGPPYTLEFYFSATSLQKADKIQSLNFSQPFLYLIVSKKLPKKLKEEELPVSLHRRICSRGQCRRRWRAPEDQWGRRWRRPRRTGWPKRRGFSVKEMGQGESLELCPLWFPENCDSDSSSFQKCIWNWNWKRNQKRISWAGRKNHNSWFRILRNRCSSSKVDK